MVYDISLFLQLSAFLEGDFNRFIYIKRHRTRVPLTMQIFQHYRSINDHVYLEPDLDLARDPDLAEAALPDLDLDPAIEIFLKVPFHLL